MSETQKLTFHLEGPREAEGYVQARDFVDFMQHALSVLRRLEREQTGAAPSAPTQTEFRIVELEIGSAMVVLEPSAPTSVDVPRIFAQFAEGIAAYRDRSSGTSRLDRSVLEEIGEMMIPVARGRVRKATITVNNLELVVARVDTATPFQLQDRPETNINGTVTGQVDVINMHRDPVFYLYPSEGPRIACRFDRTDLEDVRRALKKHCRVHGLLAYTENNPYPIRLDMERIELSSPESQLRSLRSFVGTIPDFTGGLEVIEYLRRLRDDED